MEDILCNDIKVLRFVNTPVPSNTFLLVNEAEKNCVAIDPGTKEQTELRDYIRSHGLTLDYVLLTHEHFDHCWGVNYLLEAFPAKVVATRLCAEYVMRPLSAFNQLYFNLNEPYSISKIDLLAEDIDWNLLWNDVPIKLIDAKGHTNCSICINVGKALFSGDTMILDTEPSLKKKYGASKEDFHSTIMHIYNTFDPETIVYPGHGESFLLKEMEEFFDNYFNDKRCLLEK